MVNGVGRSPVKSGHCMRLVLWRHVRDDMSTGFGQIQTNSATWCTKATSCCPSPTLDYWPFKPRETEHISGPERCPQCALHFSPQRSSPSRLSPVRWEIFPRSVSATDRLRFIRPNKILLQRVTCPGDRPGYEIACCACGGPDNGGVCASTSTYAGCACVAADPNLCGGM